MTEVRSSDMGSKDNDELVSLVLFLRFSIHAQFSFSVYLEYSLRAVFASCRVFKCRCVLLSNIKSSLSSTVP